MLPYDTVHTLTRRLKAAEFKAHLHGPNRPPSVVIVVDRDTGSTLAGTALQVITMALHPEHSAARYLPLPHLLHGLGTALRIRAALDPHDRSGLDGRPVACAVIYDDLHAEPGRLARVRRLDAVDTDRRRYHLVRRHGQTRPTVQVTEPDRDPVAATEPALTEILTAVGQILAASA